MTSDGKTNTFSSALNDTLPDKCIYRKTHLSTVYNAFISIFLTIVNRRIQKEIKLHIHALSKEFGQLFIKNVVKITKNIRVSFTNTYLNDSDATFVT